MPKEAATEAGVKRGATLAAVQGGLPVERAHESSKTAYRLPVAGHDDWCMQFEFEGDTLAYLTLVKVK